MLITWMNDSQKKQFDLNDYGPFEVVFAKHRRHNRVLGYLAFSREEKKIKVIEIFDSATSERILSKLKMVASRQLHPVSKSFHSLYPKYNLRTDEHNCPVCKANPMPEGMEDIASLRYSYVSAEEAAQGRLYGKCVVISKIHNVHFYDLTDEEMMNFMSDVKKTAKALHQVTGAVKINYEIHGNSAPHLHCHLFPRYLDDDFPGKSIDYHVTEPSPYMKPDDYKFFFNQMREMLGDKDEL